MCEEVEVLRLPDRLDYNDFHGDILAFIDAAYQTFRRDFITTRPLFDGKPLGLKKHPLIANRECTFYHLTQEGEDEDNREFSINRTECIPFPRPMIDNTNHPYLKVWSNVRGGRERVLIYHEQESYLVIIEKRDTFALFWTAYPVDRGHTYRKLMKEYEAYKKARTAE